MYVTLAQLDIAWAQVLSVTLSPFSGQGPWLGLELHKVSHCGYQTLWRWLGHSLIVPSQKAYGTQSFNLWSCSDKWPDGTAWTLLASLCIWMKGLANLGSYIYASSGCLKVVSGLRVYIEPTACLFGFWLHLEHKLYHILLKKALNWSIWLLAMDGCFFGNFSLD